MDSLEERILKQEKAIVKLTLALREMWNACAAFKAEIDELHKANVRLTESNLDNFNKLRIMFEEFKQALDDSEFD
jgi:hypothetical protein